MATKQAKSRYYMLLINRTVVKTGNGVGSEGVSLI